MMDADILGAVIEKFVSPIRELSEIIADIRALEAETEGLLDEVLGV